MSTTPFQVDVHPGSQAAFPRPSFVKITRLELRKILDIRSGPALLIVTLLLVLLVLGVQVFSSPNIVDESGRLVAAPVRYADFVSSANQIGVYLVSILGLLAMTGEWTQRTALTTFTLVPRRATVLFAKLAAGVVLAVCVALVTAGLAAVAAVVRGALKNVPVIWSGQAFGGSVVAAVLGIVMAAALGALIMITAPAIVAYFVGPFILVLIVTLATQGREGASDWANVQLAFGRLSSFNLEGKGIETLTAVVLWVVLPLVLGLWRSLRRDAS